MPVPAPPPLPLPLHPVKNSMDAIIRIKQNADTIFFVMPSYLPINFNFKKDYSAKKTDEIPLFKDILTCRHYLKLKHIYYSGHFVHF